MTKKSILRLLQASLMCCLAVLFTACDDIFASEDNPTPAYLSMSDKPVTIKAGDTYRRKAISVTTAVVEYTSSDTKVATVDGEGMVTAIAKGETTITATATGYSTGGKKIFQADSKSYKLKVTPNGVATITTAPTATAILAAGSATDLVTAGVADGGTMMYEVTATNTKPTSLEGFSATIPTAAALADGTYYVWYYAKGDATHSDSEIAAAPVEVTVIKPGLLIPLTLEAITAGTIKVSQPRSGMQYTLNGGAKTPVTTDPINVAVGDKVAFYGDGTNISTYYISETNYTDIYGGTADVKVYGNIMSLVDEENFATNKTLTGGHTFCCLFEDYTTLKDASDLLLPATTLTDGCYNGMFQGCTSLTTAPAELPAVTMASLCYAGMFKSCTSLTTAPKLPATTLAYGCYYVMFKSCTSLTTAYVKAACITTGYACVEMFNLCTAAGAVLHTTTANKTSWDGVMGSTWATWTAVGDWND